MSLSGNSAMHQMSQPSSSTLPVQDGVTRSGPGGLDPMGRVSRSARLQQGWHLMLAAVLLCTAVPATVAADDWPEYRGAGRQGVWTETGILDEFPPGGLSFTWRVPIHDGYAGPAVAGGRVFVIDARPAGTGGMRMVERVLCLDEETGETLWSREWEADYAGLQPLYAIGPRGHADCGR